VEIENVKLIAAGLLDSGQLWRVFARKVRSGNIPI